MWLKLGAITTTTLALLALMLWPFQTSTTIILEQPNGVTPQEMSAVITGITWTANILSYLMIAGVIGLACWLARMVVIHHRKNP
jgi:hypothetical protein